MKTKTSELIDVPLNWAVNQIEKCCDDPWTPLFSTNWSQGGPIIEREGINIGCHLDGAEWVARNYWGEYESIGPTPLIAAMRCFVASRLGDEVEIPEELKTFEQEETNE